MNDLNDWNGLRNLDGVASFFWEVAFGLKKSQR